jgi:hypothetical protein
MENSTAASYENNLSVREPVFSTPSRGLHAASQPLPFQPIENVVIAKDRRTVRILLRRSQFLNKDLGDLVLGMFV